MKFIHVCISSSYGVFSLGDQNYLNFWPKLNILKEKYHRYYVNRQNASFDYSLKPNFSTTKLKLHNRDDNCLICVKFEVH